MTLSKRIKRDAVYFLARFLLRFLNAVPRRLGLFVGAVLGLTAWELIPKDQYKTVRHLTLALGDRLPHEYRLSVCRNWYINTGKNLVDIVRFPGHLRDELRPLVTVEGLEHFDRAYRRGRGVLGVTGHIGNFELLAAWIADSGYRTAVIGRRVYDERLDRLLTANREAVGLSNMATTVSPRKILRWLQAGGALGVLIDNDTSRVRGVHVPVFRRPANTPVGPILLGLRANAAFVPMACLRTPDERYQIIMRPEVEIRPTGTTEAKAIAVTASCSRELEAIITAHPDQWIWFHNRWHTKPPVSS